MDIRGNIGYFKTLEEAEKKGFTTPLTKEEVHALTPIPKSDRHEALRKLKKHKRKLLRKERAKQRAKT